MHTILTGRAQLRPTLTAASERPIGTTQVCERCGCEVEWRELMRDADRQRLAEAEVALFAAEAGDDDAALTAARGQLEDLRAKVRTIRYWSDCPCINSAIERYEARSAAASALQADYRDPDARVSSGVEHLRLDAFDPSRLVGGEKLLQAAHRWLEGIADLPIASGYHEKPYCCLYFYSPGKGRGKTHLAAGLLNAAAARGKKVAFADEVGYIERYWATPFEQRLAVSGLPGSAAWLTVLDDLGARENPSAGVRDAWYAVLNPRWLKRGWTIITSNHTPEELLGRGTIGDSTYSRLIQMTHGKVITFNGRDQRLPERTDDETSPDA